MKHVIGFSGGVTSWMAAKRVAERHGTADMTLLFADTRMEDEDLYRFIVQAASNVGAPLVVLADGRTPWGVFNDERFLGNSRIDPCSKILKRKLLDKWRDANMNQLTDVNYVGLDWTELHRVERLLPRVVPWRYEAPLCEKPWIDKTEALAALEREGIKPPRLYGMGFPHNNCGGFCVKAGQAQFKLLLDKMPDRYRFHEEQEEALRARLGKDVSILRDRRGGESKPLTLKDFRERVQADAKDHDELDFGGCGCAIDEPPEGGTL